MYFINQNHFDNFYRELWPRVLSKARLYASNDMEAEDFCSQAFIKLWEIKDKICSKDQAERLVISIAKHIGFHEVRDKKKPRQRYCRELAFLSNQETNRLFFMCEYNDLKNLLHKFLCNLKYDRRIQFEMYLHGHRPAEIAPIVDKTAGTVDNQNRAVLNQWADWIKDSYPGVMKKFCSRTVRPKWKHRAVRRAYRLKNRLSSPYKLTNTI